MANTKKKPSRAANDGVTAGWPVIAVSAFRLSAAHDLRHYSIFCTIFIDLRKIMFPRNCFVSGSFFEDSAKNAVSLRLGRSRELCKRSRKKCIRHRVRSTRSEIKLSYIRALVPVLMSNDVALLWEANLAPVCRARCTFDFDGNSSCKYVGISRFNGRRHRIRYVRRLLKWDIKIVRMLARTKEINGINRRRSASN